MSDGQSRELTAAAAAGLVPVTDLNDGPLSAEEAAYGQASKAVDDAGRAEVIINRDSRILILAQPVAI